MHRTSSHRLPILILLGLLASACSATRPAEPWQCALVGASVGGLGGATVGAAAIADDDDDTAESTLISAGVGAAAGALAGFTMCTLMPERVEQPPPPPPVAKPAPVMKKKVVLPGVHFAFDRSDLLAPARQALDREVVPELSADSSLTVIIEGHTDATGSDEYNQKLSEQRAAAVESYLLSQGIDASRLETRGYGESQPVAGNDTESGRAENRRVEIKVMQ